MKPRIEIRLLGRFSFHCEDQEFLLHTSAKAKEILCYLIMNRRSAVRRERLAALISDAPQLGRSKKDLRHSLWRLKADLLSDLGALRDRVLRVEEEWIQFVPDNDVWLDVAEFEVAARDLTRLQHAVELYREEFLQGWDQEWCAEERERLRQMYLESLDSLITRSESNRDRDAGVAYALLALHNDSTRECTHRALMRLHAAWGDRHSALLQYERCVAALRELGICPDDETKALIHKIREGHPPFTEAETSGQTSTPPLFISSKPPQAARGRNRPRK